MKPETRRWLAQSDEEFKTAVINFRVKKYFSAAFLCQQSVEKGLKAMLIEKTRDFPKIHDLLKLAQLNKSPDRIQELCTLLNPAYTASRYPDVPKKYTQEECHQLVNSCKEVLAWIKKNLRK